MSAIDKFFLGMEKFFSSIGNAIGGTIGKAIFKSKHAFRKPSNGLPQATAQQSLPTQNKPAQNNNKPQDTKKAKPKPKFKNPFSFKSKRERVKKKQGRKRNLIKFLDQAGMSVNLQDFEKKAFASLFIIFSLISMYFIYQFLIVEKAFFIDTLVFMIMIWVFIFLPGLFLVWLIFYMLIDLRIYSRTKEIEIHLPDFLQLASANINAGMTIEESLWFAVRPRFGTLAKEMEIVAKKVISGEELADALHLFAKKFDSGVLKRTINLMIEGHEAGGKLGPLLNKISLNIKDIQITKKEMASNVSTYVIFISVATIGAAPFLLALAGQLLEVIRSITGQIKLPEDGTSFLFSVSPEYIVESAHMQVFGLVTVVISALMSAIIVATIKKGDAKSGFKYIPMFIVAAVTIYIIGTWAFSLVLGYVGF